MELGKIDNDQRAIGNIIWLFRECMRKDYMSVLIDLKVSNPYYININ